VDDFCDVLIIGGGGAGLRAAVSAYETDPSLAICLVTKGVLGQGGVTATACSDRMAFHATLSGTEPGGDDAWRYHAEDIYRIGGYVSDGDLAVVLAREAARAFAYLDELGVPWVRRSDGTVDQFLTDGSRYARACYTGPYTANDIERALLDRFRRTPVRVIEHTLVADLILDQPHGRLCGAILVNEATEQVDTIECKAIILACGGAGQVFATNVYPPECTGDGYALAYRAGAELVNLEFIQIGLCSLKTGLACSGSMMRALPRLVNEQGDEFLRNYFPSATPDVEIYQTLFAKGASWPVALNDPSHRIDIAVSRELSRGHKVYLDYRTNPDGLEGTLDKPSWQYRISQVKGAETNSWSRYASPLQRLQAINQPAITWLAERGIDLVAGDKIEIAPAVQHFQGGVKISARTETTVAGLYASGEVAGGQHGANRPGGNALLDCQVFGRIAGENAACYAKHNGISRPQSEPPQPSYQGLFRSGGEHAEALREQVRSRMSRACGVCRTTDGLQRALQNIHELQSKGINPAGSSLARAIESVNLLQVAELVLMAALQRDESRGPHLRFSGDQELEPLPSRDPEWRQYIVLKKGSAGLETERRTPTQLTLPGEYATISPCQP
jgi:succinate dehydrogenase/fumarate reductase flavoprotein subunit